MSVVAENVQKGFSRGPGLLLAVTVAFAATLVSDRYGGPQLLYALFFGIAFNFLAADPRTKPGIDFAGRTILRIGVALLGARITFAKVAQIGWLQMAAVAFIVLLTISFGIACARLFSYRARVGLLTGGAVAICGASAALAISAALPSGKDKHRMTVLTVVGVTTLSTIAMVVYPALAKLLGFSDLQSGIFIGASIHDVAQVVGAGYLFSDAAGDTATVVKLFRVSLLVPVVFVATLIFRNSAADETEARPPLLPLFLIGFCTLAIVSSFGWIPAPAVEGMSAASRWCLVVAIAALGVKTSFQQVVSLGWKPVALMIAETAFIAFAAIGAIEILS
ncbi:MAG: putative sulfate exporter family transporter [Xanthobacteraceae bacterium]|nr:putative sulfate exporter family transporter [Xanthobacteraceae bacterium]MBX3522092.1 putative sulfate exporter family transporter [Xanthobacteraceae bacterium]MCW5674002.1 putative sulfate exporter family transporter [Xanthobacteraceae bacterium]MCW5678186.1 putative sulfate exporter family transporter [Xanthobacteraceae bacterium]